MSARAGAGSARVTILGIGNTLMGDDGAGVEAAEGIDFPLGDEVQVVTGGTAGMGLIDIFLESDLVIVLDAIATEAEPGTIFRFHPDEAGITKLRSNNVHGMGVGYLLTSARMKGINPDVVVLAVQVGDVRPSADCLSPAVAAALPRVRELVLEQVEEWRTAQ